MAVDVKSLRIGSHISINGERVEVESLQGGDMVGYRNPSLSSARLHEGCQEEVRRVQCLSVQSRRG